MKIEKSTRINAVLFADSNYANVRVFSANMNTTFEQYLNQCKRPAYSLGGKKEKVPNSIDQMLAFEYTFSSSSRSGDLTLNLYSYKDDRYTSSFIEIV